MTILQSRRKSALPIGVGTVPTEQVVLVESNKLPVAPGNAYRKSKNLRRLRSAQSRAQWKWPFESLFIPSFGLLTSRQLPEQSFSLPLCLRLLCVFTQAGNLFLGQPDFPGPSFG